MNTVVYWLGLITLGFGLVTLWDRYQTDQAFGLPVETAASVSAALVMPMVVLFAVVAFRNGLLWPGLRRRLQALSGPLIDRASWARERFKARTGWLLGVDGRWYRWFERQLTVLTQGLLREGDLLNLEREGDKEADAIEDSIEAHLVSLWNTVELRDNAWIEQKRFGSLRTPVGLMDDLWVAALLPVACDAIWFGLPRPMSPNVLAALLLQVRLRQHPDAVTALPAVTWSWRWADMDGCEVPGVRKAVRSCVLDLLRHGWMKAHGAECPLDDADLWSLLVDEDEAELDQPEGGLSWEVRLIDAIDSLGCLEDIFEALKPIRLLDLQPNGAPAT